MTRKQLTTVVGLTQNDNNPSLTSKVVPCVAMPCEIF